MQAARRFDLTHVSFEGATRRVPANTGRSPRLFVPVIRLPARRVEDEASTRSGFPLWVLAQAGLDAASYRGAPLERRMAACLRALKVPSEAAARTLLAARPDLLGVAVNALLIGVTEFFRDEAVFRDLRTKALPVLAARPGPLRVWSAGCSSGAEVYSIAILLAEAHLLGRSTLLGTDCRSHAIAEAEAAVYPAAIANALPAAIRTRYLEAFEKGWRPNAHLRRAARWKVADLLRNAEPGPWDIIFCRNILIYVGARTSSDILDRLSAELRPGGFLVLGKAEVTTPSLPLVRVARCIYRKG